jgi:hypothetical protein
MTSQYDRYLEFAAKAQKQADASTGDAKANWELIAKGWLDLIPPADRADAAPDKPKE